MKRAFAPAPYGVVEKVPPRREGIPSIELFAVGTGLRACPFAGWSQSGQPRKGGQARRPVPTKPPRPSTPREPPCRCSRNRVFQQPLDRGYKKAMCPRRVEGALLFLTPLSRGGRGGAFMGFPFRGDCLYPFRAFFNNPRTGRSDHAKRLPRGPAGEDERCDGGSHACARASHISESPASSGATPRKRPNQSASTWTGTRWAKMSATISRHRSHRQNQNSATTSATSDGSAHRELRRLYIQLQTFGR